MAIDVIKTIIILNQLKKNSLLDKINTNEIDKKLKTSNKDKWLRIFPNSLDYKGGNDGFFIARVKKIT